MAEGRGGAHAASTLLLILSLQSYGLWDSAVAAIHTVGSSQRWDVGIDYTTWAAGQTFRVGDVLFFPYSPAEHNVVVVNKAGYDACSDANAIATFDDGNTNVTLSSAGTHYYLCSLIGHCAAGMKLAVTVSAAVAPPTPPPAPTASPPRPAPSPVVAPSTAPSSASTPVSAPVPTPSAEAPASAATPSSPAPVPTMAPPAFSPSAPTPSSPAPVPTMAPPAFSPGSTPSSPGTPLSSPPPPPNSAPSFLPSAAIAPLLVLSVAFTLLH